MSCVGGVYTPVGCRDPVYNSAANGVGLEVGDDMSRITPSLRQLLFTRGHYKAEYFLCIITVLLIVYSYFLP